MNRTILVFGLIAGLIVSAFMAIMIYNFSKTSNFESGMWMGYASMIIAFSFVFVGIKSYRDKHNSGIITFGKAFKIGFFISLIASTMYVVTWLIEYYNFVPDFMERYSAHMLEAAKKAGATAAELDAKTAEMKMYAELYKNPLMVVLLTYMEILPVGLVVSAISALILKRKTAKADIA